MFHTLMIKEEKEGITHVSSELGLISSKMMQPFFHVKCLNIGLLI